MTESLLQIYELDAGYQKSGQISRKVVNSFSATLPSGKLVCLIGPNGAGKSTLLRTISGMQKPLHGKVMIDGLDIYQMSPLERAQRLSVVLTQKMEVGLLTGYDLVAMGRYPYTGWLGQLSKYDHSIVQLVLKMVDAEGLVDRLVHTLSDGERQKLMIARALAQEPDLMLLDEPTAFLDLPRRVECMMLLRDLTRKMGRTIVMSIHDLDLAMHCSDQIWLLPYSGQIHVGSPEDLVLDGIFESVFCNDRVTFDIQTGSFKAHQTKTKDIILQGQGVYYVWTKHALEREGFCVSSENKDGLPIVRIENIEKNCWWFTIGQNTIACHSIACLIEVVHDHCVDA